MKRTAQTLTEGMRESDVFYQETNAAICRARRVVTGGNFQLGEVVAKKSGKYVKLNPAANDTSAVAAAVVRTAVDATAADASTVLQIWGTALVSDAVVWPAGMTLAQRSLAAEQLELHGLMLVDAQ